jgi:hypothetical protein
VGSTVGPNSRDPEELSGLDHAPRLVPRGWRGVTD